MSQIYHPRHAKKASSSVPFVFSLIYTVFVIIYANDYMWDTYSIVILSLGILMNTLLFPRQIPSSRGMDLFIRTIAIIGSLAIAFQYNLNRIEEKWGFFSYYHNSLGYFLGLYQLTAIVAMLLFALQYFMPQISSKVVVVFLFISGVMGLAFQVYEMSYLENRWGTPVSAFPFHIYFAFVSLFWFVTQATYSLTNKRE